jgi:hypothetical protein
VRTRASNFMKPDIQDTSIFSYIKGLSFVGFQPADGPRKVLVSLSTKCRICIAQNYRHAIWLARTNASTAANMRGNFSQPVPHDSTGFGVSLVLHVSLSCYSTVVFMTDESKLLATPPKSTETLEQLWPHTAATSRVGVQ